MKTIINKRYEELKQKIYETFQVKQYEKIKKIDELTIRLKFNEMRITDENEQYEELKQLLDDFGDNKKVLSYSFEKLEDNIRACEVELAIEKNWFLKDLVGKMEGFNNYIDSMNLDLQKLKRK